MPAVYTDILTGLPDEIAPTAPGSYATLAAAGSVIGNAAALTTARTTKVTGADGTKGVQLPVASPGTSLVVINDPAAANLVKVYPQVNGTINGGSANASINHTSSKVGSYHTINGTDWFSLISA